MAYTAFDNSNPSPTQTGTNFANSAKANLLALRDAVVMGAMAGWACVPSGADLAKPTTIKYNRGTSEYLRLSLTWGTTGGAAGKVTGVVYAYSTDDATYDTIGTRTITYSAEGYFTGASWS